MSDNLIPISDKQAKLGQAILETFRALGSFLDRALGSTPEDLVGYFGGDRLRVRRAENMARMLYEAQARLEARGITETKPATLSVALPILQGAADEDRAELVDLWARLLANAMDPGLRNVRASFISAVKKMDPPDAIVLQHLYRNGIDSIQTGNNGPSGRGTSIGHISQETNMRPESIEISLVNLQSVGFYLIQDASHTRFVTAMFREFMRACYPESPPTN